MSYCGRLLQFVVASTKYRGFRKQLLRAPRRRNANTFILFFQISFYSYRCYDCLFLVASSTVLYRSVVLISFPVKYTHKFLFSQKGSRFLLLLRLCSSCHSKRKEQTRTLLHSEPLGLNLFSFPFIFFVQTGETRHSNNGPCSRRGRQYRGGKDP